MIIRSQDKYSMTDSLDLRIAKRRPPTEYDYIGEDIYTESGIFLGHYSTEEKAIKVLDMICEHAEAMHFSKIVPEQCDKIWGNVFNMPQDSEV